MAPRDFPDAGELRHGKFPIVAARIRNRHRDFPDSTALPRGGSVKTAILESPGKAFCRGDVPPIADLRGSFPAAGFVVAGIQASAEIDWVFRHSACYYEAKKVGLLYCVRYYPRGHSGGVTSLSDCVWCQIRHGRDCSTAVRSVAAVFDWYSHSGIDSEPGSVCCDSRQGQDYSGLSGWMRTACSASGCSARTCSETGLARCLDSTKTESKVYHPHRHHPHRHVLFARRR